MHGSGEESETLQSVHCLYLSSFEAAKVLIFATSFGMYGFKAEIRGIVLPISKGMLLK